MPKMVYDQRTALIVVDMQNDFCNPGGSLYVQGAQDIIYDVNEETQAAREAGALVVFTQDWHPAVTNHFDSEGGRWPAHCVIGSWGAAHVTGLIFPGDYEIVRKGSRADEDGYSAFTVARELRDGNHVQLPTELADLIGAQRPAVEHVVVCGVALDVCVSATALDAKRILSVDVTVPTSLTAAVSLTGAVSAVAEMERAGIKIVD